jgi:N-acetylmuramoyl-L-alanine amidase
MRSAISKITFIIVSFFVFAASSWSSIINSNEEEDKRIAVVVIDPGHGGKDLGASIGNVREKDIVLDLAKRLGQSINANYPEIKVIYTRTNDVFIPLHKRAEIANKNKADLFISIHVNGTERSSVYGTETYVLGQHRSDDNLEVAKKENSVILLEDDYITTYEGYDPNSPESEIMFELVQDEYLEQSVMLASEIQTQFNEYAKRLDRSVKQAGFLVLRQTTMPSVLVEVGFISNPKERSYMLSESGKSTLATSILIAFNNYKRKIEDKSNFAINTASNNKAESDVLKEPNPTYIYFSVQIGASKKKLNPTPSNFKGEQNIFRIQSRTLLKYFSGKFDNYEDAVKEKIRIEEKFPDAFVVAFENNELISVKKAREKM